MLNVLQAQQGVFVTGTDTGVGKTFVAALLCLLFKNEQPLKYFKPVQTGYPQDDDTDFVCARAKLAADQFIEPVYRYTLPASPDRAAAAVNAHIEEQKILKVFRSHRDQFIIAEGAGGLEVPLRDNYRMIDLMRDVRLPAVVVASTRLGTINHTLLTLKSLRFAGVPILGVVLSGPKDDGLEEVLRREGAAVLAHIPQVDLNFEQWTDLAQTLAPVREALIKINSSPSIESRDGAHVWHPFTQHKTEKEFPVITRGYGATVQTESGHALLDATSSWWVNLHGHSHPEMVSAIASQAAQLEHVIFAGYTHAPAVELSARLLEQVRPLNPQWSRVFFSDNGSTAVEVALKMAYQFQELRGEKRGKFLALKNSYHGDTLGAMSVSERNGYHKYFLPLMMPVDHIEAGDYTELEKTLGQMDSYAACIVEPMVQGAGGMRMYDGAYLKKLQSYCQAHGVLLIADEIFTGFGRTGTFLASEHAKFQADLVCLSKGITGGFLPLSVTIATEDVYNAFLGDSKAQAFLHGHSYTANPLACAAALKSLEILQRPVTQSRIHAIGEKTKQHLLRLAKKHQSIADVRHLGTIGALDLKTDENYFTANLARGIAEFCFHNNVLLRPLGSTIYTVPPYCTTDEELERIYETISMAIGTVVEGRVE